MSILKEVLNFGLDLLADEEGDQDEYTEKKTDMYGWNKYSGRPRFDPMHPASDKNGYVNILVDF